MYSNRKKFKIQGKTASHKKALVRSLVIELIRNGRIKTTPKKAKVLKKEFDKLVTTFKKDTRKSNQIVMSFFAENKRAFDRLGQVVSDKLSDRNSGYTRVIKTLPRKGDNAEQAYVMLVNTEIKEKKSRLKKMLEERDEVKEEKGVRGRISKAVENVTSSRANVSTKKREVRRNSK
ncbi:50S ribosomal protein L17 [Candidatus Dojkabacteria bacterium]|uniref:50S ribosomal protein L17 n=1 Tax=Candidatus Dojkabacteria bacterium TaxID=2099670 RepID=A0A955L9V9_9BACT|nr:50S ribosomal protein L17 [Candidatus Dojkabacteria bacterium]